MSERDDQVNVRVLTLEADDDDIIELPAVDDVADLGPATFEMQDDINRILIGLGGQGSRLVNEVARYLDQTGKIPPSVEFIAVDSDRIALASFEQVPEQNRIYLGAPEERITETMVPWLPREYRPKAGGGCGMQRITGKAMHHVHRQRIFETINSVVRRLKERTQSNNFMFVIVNAFGGGTGSGMVIDFTLDLRRNMIDLIGQEPMIFGLGVLPSRNETIQRANGVALLKELHFLLSHKEPVFAGGRDISNPFELYFIVGREQTGIEKDDELTRAVTRFVVDLGLIPSHIKERNPQLGKGGGFVDLQDIRTLIKGSSHMFATFGSYNAYFPYETLEHYFDIQDRLAQTKDALPRIVGAMDRGFHGIQDRKVALRKMDETVERALGRARRLRASGIFSINKSELVRLNEDITALEERIKRERRDLEETERNLPRLEAQKADAEERIRVLESERGRVLQSLARPPLLATAHTPALSPEEVEKLATMRSMLRKMSFREIMDFLGRTEEYLDKTMEVVGKNKILFMPMLNYRMAFHTAALFKPEVLRTMANYGFVKFDGAGNPVITEDQMWMVLAMISSHKDNIDPDKLGARAFKDIVENYIAKRAEVKSLQSQIKLHEVNMYSWMIGLQISPVAPGYPPRLRELEWLTPEYDKLAHDPELIQHHAFLYGDPLAFQQLTGLRLNRLNQNETNNRITSFWSDYAPLDPVAKWGQIPPVLAEGLFDLEEFQTSLERLMREFESLPPIPTMSGASDASRRTLTGITTHIERVSTLLTEFTDSVNHYVHVTNEEDSNLIDRLARLQTHLKTTREPPRDRDRLNRMIEMADALLADVQNLLALTETTRGILANEVAAYARELYRLSKDMPVADRTTSSMVSRHQRTMKHLEEQVQGAVSEVGGLEIVLHKLAERTADLNGEMKKKAGTGKDATRRIVPSAGTSDDEPRVSHEEAVLERILRDKEGGI